MKQAIKYKTDQFIGKLVEKGEDIYTFVSLTLEDFVNQKCKIDDGDENVIFEFFLQEKKDQEFLRSLQKDDIVTYFARFPVFPKNVPSELSFNCLLQEGMVYWHFKHYEDKQIIGKLNSLFYKTE